ncbi:MAG: class I SAM-dependent methyltransferase [Bdellovibrionaceae bacterium]|nr:class I SAM-dependent methyltransferase [Pseudobdellovibrionaceae bacterium]
MKENILIKNAALGFSLMRTLNFNLQGRALPIIANLFSDPKQNKKADLSEHFKIARPKIEKLLREDAGNMARGDYPISVLKPENLISHAARIPFVYIDAVQSALRRKKNETKKFKSTPKDFLKELPAYYKRNFHFQTDGYLGETSAKLYEHQVEILFSGAANAMRRLILPQMKKHFNHSDGEGLKFLEIGSGTGSLTKFVALAFPKAQITCLDLSHEYLKLAQENLKQFKRINYTHGAGEKTDFKSNSFDAVFSCFLFHELPHDVRFEMSHEAHRLLKKQGFFGCVDSLQYNDDPEFNWALDRFPIDFHEPFFKDYTRKPLTQIWKNNKFSQIETQIGFLAKCVTGIK